MTYGGLHSDECCLWTSVVVSPLTSSPLLPPLPLIRMTSVYVLVTPIPKSPRVRCHHSATQWFGRETQGPSVSPLEPPGPFCSVAPKFLSPFPTTVLFLTPVTHWCSQHPVNTVPSTCGGGGRGVYSSHNDFTPPPTLNT